MEKSIPVANAELDSGETVVGTSPKLQFWDGIKPAKCADPSVGIKLVEMTLPSDWLLAAASASKAMSGVWSGSGLVAGKARYWRITNSAGTVTHFQGLLGEPYANSKALVVDQYVVANGNVYGVTVAGTTNASGTGPNHTSGTATNGGVTFAYIGPADMTIDNTMIAVNQAVAVSSFVFTAGGV